MTPPIAQSKRIRVPYHGTIAGRRVNGTVELLADQWNPDDALRMLFTIINEQVGIPMAEMEQNSSVIFREEV